MLHNNFNAAQICEYVNILFSANGWKTLAVETLRQLMERNKALFTPGRQGAKKFKSTHAMQVKRKATDEPMKYWTLDGWTVELLFQEKGKKGMEYKRMVMVVVLDAMNKYPVGYAIGERETAELIREANRNAIIHIQSLLGEPYRPWQVQSDNYQIKHLTPFYQAMAHLHTPAAVGNAKAKIIEPYFKYLNTTYCQPMPNWTGHNVTANRDNQVNAEWLDKTKHSAPDRAGVEKQITAFMERERREKVEEFMAKWATVTEKPEVLSGEDWLMVFGQVIGKTSKIVGQGIIKEIAGVPYTYDSFDPAFRKNSSLDWTIIGDVQNLSRVLAVSPDEKLRFVLEEKRVLPMDVRSSTAEDHAYRAKITNYNKVREDEIKQLYGDDANIAREVVANTPLDLSNEQELGLKLMLTERGQQKERIQDNKGLNTVRKKQEQLAAKIEKEEESSWMAQQREYNNRLVDVSKYAE